MKNIYKIIFLLSPLLWICPVFLGRGVGGEAFSQAIQWQKSLGGTSGDVAFSIQQTADGGYVVAG